MEEHKDKLKDFMGLSKMELPFDDFDSQVMARIEKLEAEKASINRTRKYALFSFAFGAIFGIGFTFLITEFLETKITDPSLKNYITIFSQMIYVFLFVILSDKVLKLRQMKKNSEVY
ncbi:hypothetical protein [Sphingobacterium endophyticum]|uniref:hypothetical protein n=1 Tax=Sphingobacterium endophyticum TaxID=2546448 RepID=UPI0012E1681F|nr:hypothetical protein [Sphingobacterium endophyticum]